MIYVCSDLHGYPLDKFQKMLEKISFGKDDFMYILGDVVDRGDNGIEILMWLKEQDNIELLMGNHELMMLKCEFIIGDINEENCIGLELTLEEKTQYYMNWLSNGGNTTLAGLKRVKQKDRKAVFEYIKKCPLYEDITVGGRRFVLTHSAIADFREDKPLSEYKPRELVWTRHSLEAKYFTDGTMCVFGHTPTVYFGSQYADRAIFTDTWIDVDTGAGYGYTPMILRLDDLKAIYF